LFKIVFVKVEAIFVETGSPLEAVASPDFVPALLEDVKLG
jgi:hypothetical protein